jgi:hypothetical protein
LLNKETFALEKKDGKEQIKKFTTLTLLCTAGLINFSMHTSHIGILLLDFDWPGLELDILQVSQTTW